MNLEMFSQLIEEDTAFRTVVANCFFLVNQKLDFLIGKVSEDTSKEPAPETDQLLTLKEASSYLKVSVPTLRNYVGKGLISTTQLSKGCNLKFKKSDLDNYLSSTRKKTQKEIEQIAVELLNK